MAGFEPLFEAGRRFEKGSVEPRPAGTLAVPSGRIAVGDPASGICRALVRAVPPGRYPVSISVATLEEPADRRVAAAMVRFSARPIARWEPALAEGDDPATLQPGQFFGYGVDAGIACFIDAEVAPAIDFDFWEQRIVPTILRSDPKALCASAEVKAEDANVVAFTSGAGDGVYASFWGLDAGGAPVVLVTEFRVIGAEVTSGQLILEEHWPGNPTLVASVTDLVEPPPTAPKAPASRKKPTPKRKPRPKAKPRAKAKPKAKPRAKPKAKPKSKKPAAKKPTRRRRR